MKRRWRKVWWLLVPPLALGGWLAWGGLIYATSLKLYVVPTKSMAPTITSGDRIAVDTRAGLNPARGEIWVFTMPTGSNGVKRVVGLPGDTIAVASGRVLIDGKPITEPYLSGPIAYTMAPVVLGRDDFFMLGDNRNASFDSHVWGPANRRQLVGRVEFRPWPPSRIGGLP